MTPSFISGSQKKPLGSIYSLLSLTYPSLSLGPFFPSIKLVIQFIEKLCLFYFQTGLELVISICIVSTLIHGTIYFLFSSAGMNLSVLPCQASTSPGLQDTSVFFFFFTWMNYSIVLNDSLPLFLSTHNPYSNYSIDQISYLKTSSDFQLFRNKIQNPNHILKDPT